jgi:HSP20 family molecular chaperone IbpA
VVGVRGRFPGLVAVDLLAEPATVTVREGRPGVTLDRSGYSSPVPDAKESAPMSEQAVPQQTDGERAAEGQPQPVPVNMYETTDAIVLVVPLAGVMADDIAVSVEGGRVTVRAAMRSVAPKDYLLHEWHYGPYERTVELPDGFGGKAEGTFNNGQLALRIERGQGTGRRTATVSTHDRA